MPLTKTGKKVLRKFEGEYGSKKGKSVFYAKEHKDKGFAQAMTKALHRTMKKAGRQDYEFEHEK